MVSAIRRVLTDDSSNIDATPASFSSGGESGRLPSLPFFMRCFVGGRFICMYSNNFDLKRRVSVVRYDDHNT